MFKIKGTVYIAVASLGFLLLNDLDIITMSEAHWNKYVLLGATILAGLGILIDPVNINETKKNDEDKSA